MKKKLTIFALIAILLVSLFTMTGCGNSETNQTNERENVEEKANETTENETKQEENTTKEAKKSEKTTKPIDKTPIDINDVNSYFFVVNGKKYSAGDKISELASSDLSLNKTGSDKELSANGYLIGGGAVLNSEKDTVFNITPFNNTDSKVKGSEAVIGGFSLNEYNYEDLSGDIEIYGGITIGTSMDDIKAVFGEPTSTREATSYSGPTYTYDAEESYREFNFSFDKEGKVKTISWQNFVF